MGMMSFLLVHFVFFLLFVFCPLGSFVIFCPLSSFLWVRSSFSALSHWSLRHFLLCPLRLLVLLEDRAPSDPALGSERVGRGSVFVLISLLFLIPFLIDFGAFWTPKMAPKSIQNRSPNRLFCASFFDQLFNRFWIDF